MNTEIQLVAEQKDLNAIMAELGRSKYLTIDTEFMRERTYWPQLCLVQLARPGDDTAYLIDPLAELDLAPLFEIMNSPDILKVFHAARQDIEIFVNLAGEVPAPIFDTQIAAMVCGYGDQVGYETLVKKIARASLDKSSRFTDWSRRPLSEKQLRYAAGDVTHLRTIFETLSGELDKSGRAGWLGSEMEVLESKSTYVVEPEDAWRRVKTRSNDPRFLGVVKALASWRETEAQTRNAPRGRILKDDAILEIAAARPSSRDQLMQLRSLQREGRKAETAEKILQTVASGLENPLHLPKEPKGRPRQRPGGQALAELLRVLLKAKAEKLGVAQRLIANAADIDALANDPDAEPALLKGWRREAFGEDALKLIAGEIALSAGPSGVRVVPVGSNGETTD